MRSGVSAEGLCKFHDPARREEVTEERRRGARTTTALRRAIDDPTVTSEDTPPEARDLETAVPWLTWVALQLATGGIAPSRAREITNAMREFRNTQERLNLDRRLKDLEQQMRRQQMRVS